MWISRAISLFYYINQVINLFKLDGLPINWRVIIWSERERNWQENKIIVEECCQNRRKRLVSNDLENKSEKNISNLFIKISNLLIIIFV